MDTQERAVDADLLRGDRELERLLHRVGSRIRPTSGRVPGAERQEADALRVLIHRSTNDSSRGPYSLCLARCGCRREMARVASTLPHSAGGLLQLPAPTGSNGGEAAET